MAWIKVGTQGTDIPGPRYAFPWAPGGYGFCAWMLIARSTMSDAMNHNRGFALVAALLLVAVVSIMTATVLQTTSTEVQISGNHKRAVQDFYVAEAGLAEARVRLWKTRGAPEYFIGGAGPWSDPLWTAYIVGSADWSPSVDPEYSPRHVHVIPVRGNPANTVVLPNSFQTALPYWVKIRHKTEYDAEQDGHASATPHYVDRDGIASRHSKTNRGNVVYFGYPSKTGIVPVAFTATMPTPWLPVEKVIAHGRRMGSSVVLEEELIHPPGPPQIGALYASGGVSLDGESGNIDGHDACGMVGSLPPVISGGTVVTSTPGLHFDGNPAVPRSDSLVLNLEAALDALGRGAVALYADQHNQQLGTTAVPMVFLASGEAFVRPSGIRIRQTSGEGILLVDGNATLEGEVQWKGMILVTGTLVLQGQGNGIVVRGGMWAGQINHQSGPLVARYDSCLIQTALLAVPVQVRTWKEVF